MWPVVIQHDRCAGCMAAVEPRRANLAPRAALLCRPHSNALLGLGL